MFLRRSLVSGIFWPLTSRSIWICHRPGLIGGVGTVVWACTAIAEETIARATIQVRRALRCMRIFLVQVTGSPSRNNDEGLTNASKRQLGLGVKPSNSRNFTSTSSRYIANKALMLEVPVCTVAAIM